MPWDGFSVLKIELFDEDLFDESESLGYIETSLVLFETGVTKHFDSQLRGVRQGTIQFSVSVKLLT